MGKCTHVRSLDEIRTPSPQQFGGLIPRDSRHQKQVSGCRSNQFRHHFSKASQDLLSPQQNSVLTFFLEVRPISSSHGSAAVKAVFTAEQHLDHASVLVGQRHCRTVIASSTVSIASIPRPPAWTEQRTGPGDCALHHVGPWRTGDGAQPARERDDFHWHSQPLVFLCQNRAEALRQCWFPFSVDPGLDSVFIKLGPIISRDVLAALVNVAVRPGGGFRLAKAASGAARVKWVPGTIDPENWEVEV